MNLIHHLYKLTDWNRTSHTSIETMLRDKIPLMKDRYLNGCWKKYTWEW